MSRLLGFIEKKNILSEFKFGFSKGRATVDAINSFVFSIVQSLDSGNSSVGMFFDLSKAFDVIDHETLLRKLESMDIKRV